MRASFLSANFRPISSTSFVFVFFFFFWRNAFNFLFGFISIRCWFSAKHFFFIETFEIDFIAILNFLKIKSQSHSYSSPANALKGEIYSENELICPLLYFLRLFFRCCWIMTSQEIQFAYCLTNESSFNTIQNVSNEQTKILFCLISLCQMICLTNLNSFIFSGNKLRNWTDATIKTHWKPLQHNAESKKWTFWCRNEWDFFWCPNEMLLIYFLSSKLFQFFQFKEIIREMNIIPWTGTYFIKL